jgi:DNA-binding NarL/FixJ family response regulator
MADSNNPDRLSARESEILALLAEGLPNKQIGDRLNISSSTVRTHLMHIYKKLNVHCRTEAAAKYLRATPRSGGKPTTRP